MTMIAAVDDAARGVEDTGSNMSTVSMHNVTIGFCLLLQKARIVNDLLAFTNLSRCTEIIVTSRDSWVKNELFNHFYSIMTRHDHQ
jgi:hypothetical protein|mmetsp:Transcript_6320/g.11247  ORF Transcript_6320/g.11247 Transcript_6320/m.11247 type:complete len:86 (-) Transcript_6320:324-581(-)